MNTIKIKTTVLHSLISLLLVALFPSISLAHHSSSEFTNAVAELEGKLIQLSWRNPHPSLTFQLSSTGELWNIQIPGTIDSLAASGITANAFELGQTINIAGLVSRRADNYLQGTHVLFPDGNELILKQGLQTHWAQTEVIVNETLFDYAESVPAITANQTISYKMFYFLSFIICLLSAFFLIKFKSKNLLLSRIH